MAGMADNLVGYLQQPGANFGTVSPQEDTGQDFATPIGKTLEGILGGINETAKGALEQSENLRTVGDYNPGPVLDAALMGVGPSIAGAEKGAMGVMGGRLGMPADEELLLDKAQWAREGAASVLQKQQSQQLGHAFLPDPDLRAQLKALHDRGLITDDQLEGLSNGQR